MGRKLLEAVRNQFVREVMVTTSRRLASVLLLPVEKVHRCM